MGATCNQNFVSGRLLLFKLVKENLQQGIMMEVCNSVKQQRLQICQPSLLYPQSGEDGVPSLTNLSHICHISGLNWEGMGWPSSFHVLFGLQGLDLKRKLLHKASFPEKGPETHLELVY